MNDWVYIIIITIMPWIELRGSIPYGILKAGFNPILVSIVAILANIFVIYPAFIFLDWFFDIMKKTPMRRFIERTQEKARPYVDKYGMLGLAVFVAMPLPGTGAYAGALAAHILGIKNRNAFIAIALGVLIAGIIVAIVTLFFRSSLGFLLNVHLFE